MAAVRLRNQILTMNSVLKIGVNCKADPDPTFYLYVNAKPMSSVRIRIQVRLFKVTIN
jgi:hypothetical protein